MEAVWGQLDWSTPSPEISNTNSKPSRRSRLAFITEQKNVPPSPVPQEEHPPTPPATPPPVEFAELIRVFLLADPVPDSAKAEALDSGKSIQGQLACRGHQAQEPGPRLLFTPCHSARLRVKPPL